MLLLPILFLVLSFGLGFAALRLVKLRWFVPELVAAITVVGLLLSVWLLLAAVYVAGYQVGVWVWLVVLAALCAGSFLTFRPSRHQLQQPALPSNTAAITWAVITLVTTALLGWLLVSHMLYVRDGAYHSGGGSWGDLGLHMSLVSRFAYQSEFTWDLPIYHGAKLTYPFLLDFMSGSLLRWGLAPQAVLVIPSALFLFSFIQLFFFFAYRLFRSAAAAALGLFIFLANGSPAGIIYFWRDWQASGKSLIAFLGSMMKEYAHLADFNLRFSNIVVDFFLPQRGILVGAAAFMLVSLLWWRAHHESKRDQLPLLLLAAVIAGLLPIAHVHTFVVLFGLWLWFTVWHSWQQRSLRHPWGCGLLLMTTLAAPQVAWQMFGNFSESFSYWKIGWMTAPDESVLIFWLRNMGLGTVLLFANLWFIQRLQKNKSFHWLYYIPLVVLFLLTNVRIFQPHDYDNMKFIVFSYLGLSLYAGALLTDWFHKVLPYKIACGLVLVSLTLVGVLSIAREAYTIWPMNAAGDIAIANTFRAITPPDARILTSDQHNHFVTMLTGRPIVMGFRGWLWTYGINYQQTENDVRGMFSGSARTPDLLRKYGVSFVVIGPSERGGFAANEEYFNQHGELMLQTSAYKIYDVRALIRQ